jgi:hypothetical protein
MFPWWTTRNATYLISITKNCKTISCRSLSTNRRTHACREQRRCSGVGSTAWAPDLLCSSEDCLPTWDYLGQHVIQRYRDATTFRPTACYLDHALAIWTRQRFFFWILGYSADLGRLRTCPLFVISREEAGRETRGPHVVQVSREPCATKLDKAGEHVV